MSSLGTRFLVALTGITALVVLVAAMVVWLVARQVLYASPDPNLETFARIAQRFAERDGPTWRPPGEPPRNDNRRLALVVDAVSGAPVQRMGDLPDGVTAALSKPLPPSDRPWTLMTDDGIMRAFGIALPRAPRGGPFQSVTVAGMADVSASPEAANRPVVLYLLHDLHDLREELNRLAWGLIHLWLVATGLAFAAGWKLRSMVLRPLHRLGESIHALGPDDLSARLRLDSGPVEARTVVERLNALLDRQEQAFRREQATIANIAHELRTPVAGLRTAIEFRLRDPQGLANDDRDLLDDCLGTVVRMQDMVGNLLLLARLESGREPLPLSDIDVAALVRMAVDRWRTAATRRGFQIQVELPTAAIRHSSADHLAIILDNLLGNAVAHGNGDLIVSLRPIPTGWRLTVANPFTGSIDEKLLGTAFYRADPARRDGAHAGLGLMLCRRIASVLGATWSASAGDGRFTVGIDLTER